MQRRSVPCNGCRVCCFDLVWLQPHLGDVVEQYDHVIDHGAPALRRNHDGSCVYLGEHGCTIHERAPAMCKAFDCRVFYKRFGQNERAKLRPENVAIFEAARRLLMVAP